MNIGPLVAIVPVVLAVAMIILIIRRNVTGRSESISRDITAAIPAIVVLMVAALIIGSFASDVDDRSYELYDCVPLSSFGSDVTIDGDCAEVVTIGGVQYIRMTDLGTFTVTSGGSSKDCTVTKAKMDLVLFSGQSNSYYFTAPDFYTGQSPVAPGKAFYLGFEQPDGTLAGLARPATVSTAGIVDMTADDGSVRVAASYPAFLSGYVEKTGHRVLIVNAGIGGRSIVGWDQGADADVFIQSALDRVSELASDGSIVLTSTVALWSQGEADATRSEGSYRTHLMPFLNKLWDGGYGYTFENVLTSLPRSSSHASPTNPALVQEAVAEQYSGFTVASSLPLHITNDDMRPDHDHYTQEIYGWLGEAFARSAASALGHSPGSQTIVMVEEGEAVASLPSRVTAYGTSGEEFRLNAAWTATDAYGTYSGALSGNPAKTVILEGLTAEATIWIWDETTGRLGIYRSLPQTVSYPWASYAASVTHLDIAGGVTSVGSGAFSGCTGLEYATIPGTLTSIGSGAFGVAFKDYAGSALATPPAGEYAGFGDGELYLCDDTIYTYTADKRAITGLTAEAASASYLVIPSEKDGTKIVEIGVDAFRGKTGILKATVLQDCNLTAVDTGSFISCTGLTDAYFGEKLVTFGSVFYGCSSLKGYDIPEGVTSILANSFWGCASMTEVGIPDSVTSIGNAAFRDCAALTSFDLPDTLVTIEAKAFWGCSHITSFDFPGTVDSIGDSSFRSCTAVTSVSFGEGFDAELHSAWCPWTFYDTDGTTVLDKTVASNLAGHSFAGTYAALVKQT